jgi:type I restriction enzyme M protein
MVIELKEENTKDSKDKIKRQARSYAKTQEIDAKYYAYRIGKGEIALFRTSDDKSIDKFPIAYNDEIIYTYFEEPEKVDEISKYQPLIVSNPYELKRIFSLCHDEIWNGGERNAQDAFDEFSKMLFLKMYDELENIYDKKPYFFQTDTLQSDEELQKIILEKYQEALQKKQVNKDKEILTAISLNKYQIHFVVKELQQYSLIDTDNDPKGLAFETFIEHYMKGEFGQFFTPRNIVDFMLQISPINLDKNFTYKSTVLDPCCGSGSFLVHSIMNYKNKYQKSKLRNGMLTWQYFANHSIYGVELNDKISVTAKINFALHDDGHENIQCSNGLNTDYKFSHLKNSVDLVLTNPPFGTAIKSKDYNDSEIEDYYDKDSELKEFRNYKEFELTSKVFDKIDIIRNKVKKLDIWQNSITSEMLFFELYYRVLKVGGIAQVVIPDGVLTNSSSQFLRDYLFEHFQILAVVSLPQFTFSHYGAGVKSSIIILKKLSIKKTKKIKEKKKEYLEDVYNEFGYGLEELEAEKRAISRDKFLSKDEKKEQNDIINEKIKDYKDDIYEKAEAKFKRNKKFQYPIFMAIAKHIGFDATGRETRKNDLPQIIEDYKEFYNGL